MGDDHDALRRMIRMVAWRVAPALITSLLIIAMTIWWDARKSVRIEMPRVVEAPIADDGRMCATLPVVTALCAGSGENHVKRAPVASEWTTVVVRNYPAK